MNITYLILAHRNPNQLCDLINVLRDKNVHFVIHIDRRADIEDFETILNGSDILYLDNRLVTTWGTFNIVQATLNGLKTIEKNLQNTERVVLLSGQDLPIKSRRFIRSYFLANPFKIYIEHYKIPHPKWPGGGISRFPNYLLANQVIPLYGGSQWFSFPFPLIEKIFKFLDLNPEFAEYFSNVMVPDESFFQTLLLNSEDPAILNNIVNSTLRLIKWDKPYLHPRILTHRDKTIVLKSKQIYARKFDPELSNELWNFLLELQR